MGMLTARGVSGSSDSLLCLSKELQDYRRLSRCCHPRRSQKRSSDPARAGQQMEKAFLASPAGRYPDWGSRNPSLPPGKHQAGLPHHQQGCAAATQALQLWLYPTGCQTRVLAPQARFAALASRAGKIFRVNYVPQKYNSE